MNELIPIETVNAVEVFASEKTIQALVDAVRKAATDFEPDTSTPAGRKEIAAQAYKVSQSKGVIDKAGKGLTDEWFRKKKVVDAGRRIARDALDELRDEIRKPLTEWEAEEKRKAEALALKAEIAADEEEAFARNDLIDREIKVREDEVRLEAERLERERVEREKQEEAERKEREERIRKEAAEDAERRAKQEKQNRIDFEKKVKADRIEAEKKAEREKQEAIEREQQRAKDEADRKERERLRLIEENELEAQRRAAHGENRRKVNNAIVKALVAGGVAQKTARTVVELVATGKVTAMSIRY